MCRNNYTAVQYNKLYSTRDLIAGQAGTHKVISSYYSDVTILTVLLIFTLKKLFGIYFKTEERLIFSKSLLATGKVVKNGIGNLKCCCGSAATSSYLFSSGISNIPIENVSK